jgi:hypothetical protein
MTQAHGRTRWKRFGLVMVPTLLATAGVGVALSQQALAASFSVSGQQFKVSADRLSADGFTQFGSVDKGQTDGHAVAVSGMSHATLTNMCQSVLIPDVPLVGNVTLKLTAGKTKPVEATNLYADLTDLSGDATFSNVDIGTAVESLNKGPKPPAGDPIKAGSFSQQATHIVVNGLHQTAWATTAGTFKLAGLGMSMRAGKHECY